MVKNHILLCDFSPAFREATNVYKRYVPKKQLLSSKNIDLVKGILPARLVYIYCSKVLILNFQHRKESFF